MAFIFAWLQLVDQHVGQQVRRKILLMVDNCTAHGKPETLPPFQNMLVELLLPNTASRLQPLDAGIIVWLKAGYGRRLLFCIFNNIDMGRESICNVSILTAMRWDTEIWRKLIKKCFDYCLKVVTETSAKELCIPELDTVDGMVRDAMECGVEFTRAGLESMLTFNDEDFIIEDVFLEQLEREIGGMCDTKDEDVINEDPNDEEDTSLAEDITVLARAMSILERCEELFDSSRKAFSDCERVLRDEKVATMKQTRIVDRFFKK